MFERHESILITYQWKPFAVIRPIDTHFPVTITRGQLVRLSALFGDELTPPQLAELAITTFTERLPE
ncbi:hypothetical protein KPL76_07105 [Subtercola sp. PAMC28395]|uniref:hypothetical protein n=1 Tax=Subtercola sp. PAMC28395 TaxID=2846775 RepID=UPI001C0B014A|nr:hypothetical protein [Subtercola sp. PAMC28395]QWT25104.1 hypothetical protein KPL76_07105 [Subtercola sp. PAMC28395]